LWNERRKKIRYRWFFYVIRTMSWLRPTVRYGSSVDFALVNLCRKGDVVVTQDYGVAAMVLGKGAYGIHQSGNWYTRENIDQLLMERHLAKKARRASSKHHGKGPRKRQPEDDVRFEKEFRRLLQLAQKE